MKTKPTSQTDPAVSLVEETMRLIMKSALDAIVCIDITGKITVWTPQAEKIFGWTEKEILGKSLPETIIPVQYREQHNKGFSNYLKTGKGSVLNSLIEISGLDKHGKEFPIELTITPIRQGDQEFFCAFIRDITERKKTEENMKTSELRYRSLIEQASDAIMITDNKGLFQDVNTHFCKKFGYQKEELIGNNVSMVIDADQLKSEPIRFDLLLAGEAIVRERKMLHKDGTIIEVEANVKMLPDGRILAIARDITERKKANAIIEASEKKLRQVLASTSDNFYVIDRNYNVILINDIAEKNLEKAWGKPVKVGTNILDIIIHKTDEAIYENFEKVFAGKRIEYELHHEQEELPAWAMVSIMPVSDENGAITGAYVVAKDISERKKAGELVIRERDLSDSIINSLPGIFYLIDENGKHLRWNKNMEIVTGYTTEEIPKLPPNAMIASEDREKVREEIQRVYRDGQGSIEAYALTKSGVKIPFYLTGIRATYENKPCLIGTGIDISTIKKAENARRESEERYRALVENAPEALVVMDVTTGKFVSVSESAVKLFKMSKEELLAIGPVEVSPEYQPDGILSTVKAMSNIGKTVAGEKPSFEWTHIDKDGMEIPCEVWLVRLPSENSILIRGSIIDITERKKAEEKLKHSYKEVRLLTEHLQQIREQERTNIAREIHDELGQQLTVLKMDASWLTKKLVNSDEAIKEKLKDLIQLLDVTVKSVRRISSELRPSLLDDLGLVAAIEWHLQEFEKRSGIITRLEVVKPDMPVPEELKTGLYRIFQESLTNVARHAQASEVKVTVALQDGNIILSIGDNGNGFDRLKASGKKTLGILGMEERTTMMGGQYKINSSPGKGTMVTVSVPAGTTNIT